MVLPVKFSGSHWLNLFEDSHCSESLENLPREFHRLSINSVQFAEVIVVWRPLNLLLPGFNRIVSLFPQTEYGFGSGILINSTAHWPCRYPPLTLEIDQAHASGFRLTTHQLFLFPWNAVPLFSKDDSLQKLNPCQSFSRWIAARRVVFMNILQIAIFIFKSFIGSPSCLPYIFLTMEKTASINMGCVRRYLEVVVPVFFWLSWSTEELAPCAKGFSQALLFWATSSPVTGFPLLSDLSLRIVGVFWIFFFLMRRVSALLFQ